MRQKQTRHAQGKGASLASGQRGPLLYRLEDTPAIGKRLLYSLQFVVIFMGSVVLVPMLVAEPLGWSQEQVAFLLQCAIFTGGIATFVQAKGIGPVGARLPILLGTTFVTITPLVAITTEYGYDAFLGGVIAGGIVYVLVACFGARFLRRFFSSTVSGTLVVAIALTLAPSCADMAAGGSAPVGGGYSTWQNWLLAILTMAICLIAHLFGKGFWRTIGLFMGLAAGYVLALLLGDVAFGGVMEAAWFSVPRPFAYGVSFRLEPVLIMVVIYLVTAMEFVGDTTATAMVCADRLPTHRELRGGLLCDALSSVLSGVFNFAPNISYSDGVGIIGSTRVASRAVMVTSGLLIVAAGLVPKFAALLSTVPAPVLGGACLFLTGVMLMAGVEVILTQPLTLRNSVIVGTSLAVGIGLGFSGVLEQAPMAVRTLFSGIPGTALTGAFLHGILPKD